MEIKLNPEDTQKAIEFFIKEAVLIYDMKRKVKFYTHYIDTLGNITIELEVIKEEDK